MNKILVIGHGYVGSAVSSIFKKSELTIIDPKFSNVELKDVCNYRFDIIFVCVDTPKNENFKLLDSILTSINKMFLRSSLLCIKSTASPHFLGNAEKKYKNIKMVFYPEYLSHHSNIKDFQNQNFMILGGNKNAAKKIANILKPRLKKIKNISFTDIETAALVKYCENVYLASKVTLFNDFFDTHKKLKLKSSFREFVRLLTLDQRIGASNTKVPGRDGKRGWGGHCYTKDVHEYIKFSNSKLLKNIVNINHLHRGNA